jgi:hypothetical protein
MLNEIIFAYNIIDLLTRANFQEITLLYMAYMQMLKYPSNTIMTGSHKYKFSFSLFYLDHMWLYFILKIWTSKYQDNIYMHGFFSFLKRVYLHLCPPNPGQNRQLCTNFLDREGYKGSQSMYNGRKGTSFLSSQRREDDKYKEYNALFFIGILLINEN